ncbi:response regulator [Mesorhizobium sp. 113-1-2]|uniref:response regulator n=1 Tax=Mesorhizobium sp. 113-1-2 TaxID=2744515 RepID=UPI000819886D|nr:response regulator [Mesorhizobium sp. 113-1-2]BAV47455.1 Response regulator receiver domain protein [Mesorhizobium loti]BCG70712.1 response regulator [Mesorhizobium sp. 113-1-2]
MTTLSGRRVLIVEDESLIAMMAEDFLIELGVAVIGPATSIDGAIAMIETQEIDAAVLDINIRGERSDRVAEALRLRGIPIVCATGYGEGAAEFAKGSTTIAKPYSKEKLDHSLRALFG